VTAATEEQQAAVPRGILHELEQHRLRKHGHQALTETRELCDELLKSQVLPGMVAALLGSFREDVELAIEAKTAAARRMMASMRLSLAEVARQSGLSQGPG
jgi:hypothetical protein